MGKAKTMLGILGMVTFGLCASILMAAQTDFSGVWVLDKGKSRPLPHELKNYTMTVTQTEQQLTVENNVEGDVQPQMTDNSLGGNMVNVGAMRSSFHPGTLALSLKIPRVTYSLDGKDSNVDATTSVKAKRSKDGKTLDLSIVQKNSAQSGQGATVTTKERWTLAEGGEELKVQRSVAAPEGTDVVNLVFRKGSGKP
jgi:DsbC/DsbD-like thiol-disulfide interchange protein